MPVITITGLYGAGRETIGQMVAERLGAELVDRKIFEEVSRRLDLPPEEVEKQEESPASLLDRVLQALGTASVEFAAPPEATAWTPPFDDPAYDTRKAVLHVTQEVIKEAARTGRAVIVGRGGAYVLGQDISALHVFLHGSDRQRVAQAQEMYKLGAEEARRKVKQVDANRGAYIRQVYNHDWKGPEHYHLLLDSSHFGWRRTADLIVAAVS
jgi:cytidylate kinase